MGMDRHQMPPSTERQQSEKYGADQESTQTSGDIPKHQAEQFPSLKISLPIMLAVCLATFLSALDRTIIGVAVPAISNTFDSFDDIAWYESAYLLTFAALDLPMGKIYTFVRTKWVFVSNIVLFEVGSVICAAAPDSIAFIVGRAIAGVASAGLSTGAKLLVIDLFPPQDRPKYQGLLGATFGLASIAGPLLGGVFTTKVTWRWCFWINLPIGGVALAVVMLLLPTKPAPKESTKESLVDRIKEFDPIGTALVVPGLILLLLALQWGGNENDWSSARVLVTLILGIVLLVAFGISQIWIGDNGVMPPRIICQRTVAAASAINFGFGSALVIVTFYVPIWYQAVKGMSAVDAGIRMLGYFLTTTVFVILSGVLVSKIGYYTPFVIVGTALSIVGCGLLSTLSVGTTMGQSIGFQIVTGVGLGLTLAQPIIAIQTVLPREDAPVGLTIANFANFASGTIFISVCQAILASTLRSQLREELPDLDVSAILSGGASDIADQVTKEQLPLVLRAYSYGIDRVFYVALGLSCLAFVASWGMEWKSVKTTEDQNDAPVP